MIVFRLLKKLDMFGHTISVNYKGEDAFKTKIGGFVSIAAVAFIIFNTIGLVNAFLDHSNQQETFQKVKEFGREPLRLDENMFNIGLVGGANMPIEVGKWQAFRVHTFDSNKKEELALGPCSESEMAFYLDYMKKENGVGMKMETMERIASEILCI